LVKVDGGGATDGPAGRRFVQTGTDALQRALPSLLIFYIFYLNTRRVPKDPVTASFHSSTCGRYNFARRTLHQLAQKNQKFEDKAFYFAGNTLELKMQSNRVHERRRHQTPASSRRFRRGAEA
jgi:hypothetical protein